MPNVGGLPSSGPLTAPERRDFRTMRAEWLEKQKWQELKLWLRIQVGRLWKLVVVIATIVLTVVNYAAEIHDKLAVIFNFTK
jgi:hypothetical protein